MAPYRLVNIGGGSPVTLMAFIAAIEDSVGRPITKNFMDMQPGDVAKTWADTTLLEALTGFKPTIPMKLGVARFVEWFRDFYRV